jgi:hypothetical protein
MQILLKGRGVVTDVRPPDWALRLVLQPPAAAYMAAAPSFRLFQL